MRKQVNMAFVLTFVFMTISVFPAFAAGPKIGIIDTQRVLRESRAAREAREAIARDLKEKQAVYQAKEQEIVKMQEDFNKQRDGLSEAAAKDRQEDLAKSLKELKRLKIDLEEELNRKHRELTEAILKELAEIISDFRDKKGYALIVERKNVVAIDPDIDITGEILKLYDRKK